MTWTRREFLRETASCAAHMGLMAAASPWPARELWASQERFPVAAREPWGRLERVADGVWALVSTPLEGDRTTLCNGGIVAGRSGVLVVEAFASDAGARWMAEQARSLTGRPATHVLLTHYHYHADHTGGIRGAFEGADVKLLATGVTRDLSGVRNQGAPTDLLGGVEVLAASDPTEMDLGGRTIRILPRRGHTASDVTLEVSDPPVTFCGDLVWNGMFPNYVDAVPSRLSEHVRLLRAAGAATYVPGHGALADAADLDRYLSLLDDVEGAARRAVQRGLTAEAAGAEYRIPATLGEWTLFNPRYFERALGAWMKEMGSP
ncbi:MAG: MBL fold metallo-hydrolase [Gemmatimonadetes bacterium]|nr:MBL fold metallo-hydrolase [Gemmatimonadota bacterium]